MLFLLFFCVLSLVTAFVRRNFNLSTYTYFIVITITIVMIYLIRKRHLMTVFILGLGAPFSRWGLCKSWIEPALGSRCR